MTTTRSPGHPGGERLTPVACHIGAEVASVVPEGGADERATPRQTTHASTIIVRYPFHPYCGRELEVVSRSRRHDGVHVAWITVRGVDRCDLKIPRWMLAL